MFGGIFIRFPEVDDSGLKVALGPDSLAALR
jgi:hypothetical protein